MADASKLKRLRRSSLGSPPPVEEARSDLTPIFDPAKGSIRQDPIGVGTSVAEKFTTQADVSAKPFRVARIDGRSLRRSGRTIQFATRVSPEFDERIRRIAKRDGMLLVEVLEKALDAYENRS